MFCSKCGNQVDPNARFCPVCGNVMQAMQPNQAQPINTEPRRTIENGEGVSFVPPQPPQQPRPIMQQPMQPPMQQPMQPNMGVQQPPYQRPVKQKKVKGPKKAPKKGILIAVAAVLVLAIALVAFNFSVITNFFKKTFTTKETYLKDVNIKATNEIAESIGSLAESLSSFAGSSAESSKDQPTAAKGSISVELGDKGTTVLGNFLNMDVSWAKNLVIDYEIHNDDNTKVAADIAVKLNKKTIVTIEVIVDIEKQTVYIHCPELGKEYIKVPMSAFNGAGNDSVIETPSYPMTSSVGIIGGQDAISQQIMSEMLEKIPEPEVIERIVKRYLEVIFESFDNVKREGDKIEVDGVSQRADKYTVKITEKTIKSMVKNILKTVKSDDDIEDIIKSSVEKDSDTSAKEAYESFVGVIDRLLDTMDEEFNVPEFTFKYYTWVNNTGDIVGLSFNTEEISFSYLAPESGRKFARQIKVVYDGTTVEIEGSGTRSGNKVDVKYTLSVMETKIITIEFSDFDTKKFEEGYPNGTVTIAPSASLVSLISSSNSDASSWASLLKDLKIKIDMETSETSAKFKLSLLAKSDLIVALGVGGEEISNKDVKIPSTSIDSTDSKAMENWVAAIDIDKFIKSLEAAGIPSSLFQGILG